MSLSPTTCTISATIRICETHEDLYKFYKIIVSNVFRVTDDNKSRIPFEWIADTQVNSQQNFCCLALLVVRQNQDRLGCSIHDE
jgi:hypothetical protein